MQSSGAGSLILVLICSVCVGGLFSVQSHAKDRVHDSRAFGHRIRFIYGEFESRIVIGGKEIIRRPELFVERELTIKGTGVLIGKSRFGGFSCEDGPFIISFPKKGSPRLDGDFSCEAVEPTLTILKSSIIIQTPASVDSPGKRWRWTPEQGTRLEATIEFGPTLDGGWAALRSRKLDHLRNLLDYEDLYSRIRQAVAEHWGEITSAMLGPGEVEYQNDLVVAHACEPHFCGDKGILIVADTMRERFFIAWFGPENDDFLDHPPIETWSKEAQGAFQVWAARNGSY